MNSFESEKRKSQQTIIKLVIYGFCAVLVTFIGLHVCEELIENPRLELIDAILYVTDHISDNPLNIGEALSQNLGTILVLWLVTGGILVMGMSDKSLRKHDNPETVNGAAHFMTPDEWRIYTKEFTNPYGRKEMTGKMNMILSNDLRLGLDGWKTGRNNNVLCVGGAGSGKSRSLAAPNILQYNCNYVITDPSGELIQSYGKALEDNGYKVKVFNLTNVYAGNRYNPFCYIHTEKDVFILVDTVIKNTNGEGRANEPFWENADKQLLYALVLYLWHKVPVEEQTFGNVTKLLAMAKVDENNSNMKNVLDGLFDELEKEDPNNLAVRNYKQVRNTAGKTLKSIISSVSTRLKAFTLSDIEYLTSADEMDFETFTDSKQALFVIIPTADTTFNFVVSMMYSQLLMTQYAYVEKRVELGYQIRDGFDDVIKVFQANNKKESKDAKAQAVSWIKEIRKKGLYIERNDERELYEIRIKGSKELVAWRGTKKMAELYMQSLSKVKMEQCSRHCPNYLNIVLDEFANVSQIPDFEHFISTFRKYWIFCFIIIQAISQIKDIYKEKTNILIGNCDTIIDLGTSDPETNKFIMEKAGNRTTTVENTSYTTGGNSSGSTSYNKSKIELITAEFLGTMKRSDCLVMVQGVNPYFGRKYNLESHRNYKYAASVKNKFEIPNMSGINKPLSDIPLYKRQQMKEEEMDISMYTDAIFGDPSPFMPDDYDSDRRDIENRARELEAEENSADAEAVADVGDIEQKREEDLRAFMRANNLHEGMTDEEIRNAAEAKIDELVFVNEKELEYKMTN